MLLIAQLSLSSYKYQVHSTAVTLTGTASCLIDDALGTC